MKRSPILMGLFQSLGLVAYVAFVVCLLTFTSSKYIAYLGLSRLPDFLAPAFMLTMLVISVLICGAIGLGYPIWIFRQGKTKEAFKTVAWTIGWLAAFIVIFFAVVCSVAKFMPLDQGKGPAATSPAAPTSRMANPASVNCVNKGGQLEIKDSPQGQYGVCNFPSGKSCEEWALFRGECSAK